MYIQVVRLQLSSQSKVDAMEREVRQMRAELTEAVRVCEQVVSLRAQTEAKDNDLNEKLAYLVKEQQNSVSRFNYLQKELNLSSTLHEDTRKKHEAIHHDIERFKHQLASPAYHRREGHQHHGGAGSDSKDAKLSGFSSSLSKSTVPLPSMSSMSDKSVSVGLKDRNDIEEKRKTNQMMNEVKQVQQQVDQNVPPPLGSLGGMYIYTS